MIDVLLSEQIQETIKLRRQIFKINSNIFILTPLNHVFRFWDDGDVSIADPFDRYNTSSYQPEVAKLYGVKYERRYKCFIESPATRKHLYELFINDLGYMFFRDWEELRQELQHRGLR